MEPVFSDKYTLYHGDCLEILQSLGEVQALITDPPYGIDFDNDFMRFSGGKRPSTSWHKRIEGDKQEFDPTHLLGVAPTVVLWGANCFSDKLPRGSWLVWDKRMNGMPNTFLSDGETGWCNRGHGTYIFTHEWQGFIRGGDKSDIIHPNQKPVALFRWIIEKYTKPGDTILDPYMGSGSCGVAAVQAGRRYIGIEIDEEWFVPAHARIANAAGDYMPTPKERESGQLSLFDNAA